MEIIEVIIRAGAAVLAGAALGLNRDLHGKPTGVRTLRFAPSLRVVAASLAKLGQKDKAAEAVRELLKLEPQLTLSKI